MERIRHTRETQNKDLLVIQKQVDETLPVRPEIVQGNFYNKESEIHPDQIRVREYLESINEDALKEIFAEYFRKAGSDEATINWIPFDKIRILYIPPESQSESNSAFGSYSRVKGITLYAHKLSSEYETLWTVIHELSHSVSVDIVETSLIEPNNETMVATVKDKSGIEMFGSITHYSLNEFGEIISKDEREIHKYNAANEGLTELLTDKIFSTYLKRTGNHTRKYEITSLEAKLSGGYRQYWRNIQLYIGIISVLSAVNFETVEETIIRTYLRNGEIMPVELESELSLLQSELPSLIQSVLNNEDGDDSNFKIKVFEMIYNISSLSEDQREGLVTIYTSLMDNRSKLIERYFDLKKLNK